MDDDILLRATAEMERIQVEFPPEVRQDIARLVDSGRYGSLDEAIVTAARRLVRHEQAIATAIRDEVMPSTLTAEIRWSDGQCCVFCPELDLATAMDTEEEALTDLTEMAVEYVEDYLDEFERYTNSSNREQHLPYVLLVARYTTDVCDAAGITQVRKLFRRIYRGDV